MPNLIIEIQTNDRTLTMPRLTAELHRPVVRPQSAGMRRTAVTRWLAASTGTRP